MSLNTKSICCAFFYTFLGLSLVFGDSADATDLFCTPLAMEAIFFPICPNWTVNTTVATGENITSAIYFTGHYSTLSTSTFCACDVSVRPAPSNITIKYRTSPKLGCHVIPNFNNNLSGCHTKLFRLNESLSHSLISEMSLILNDHVCFGLQIEDQFVDERAITVNCNPTEYATISPIDIEQPSAVSVQITATEIPTDNNSSPAIRFGFKTFRLPGHDSEETTTLFPTTGEEFSTKTDISYMNATTEGIETEDSEQNGVSGIFIGTASGISCVVVLVVILLLIKRAQHRKRNPKAPIVKYTISVRNETTDDLVVTDNLFYNLGEGDYSNNVSMRNERHADHFAVTNSAVYSLCKPETEPHYADTSEIGNYTYSLKSEHPNTVNDKLASKDELVTIGDEGKSDNENSDNDLLTDDEKMDLYANKYISRTKSLIVERDDAYSS